MNPIGDVGAPVRHGKKYHGVDPAADISCQDSGPAIRVNRSIRAVVQVAHKLAYIEAASGMTNQRDFITRQNLSAHYPLGEVGAQPFGAGAHGCGGEIIEVMEYSWCGITPGLKQAGDAGIVLHLSERVKASKSGNEYDVITIT